MHIGPHAFPCPALVLAPMAGITDRPFRRICRRLGADLAVSEMVLAKPAHWDSARARLRRDHAGEPAPISVQLVGTEPAQLAAAARRAVAQGAQIIDINMGCPAKKVCNVAAGSALLRDERRVAAILAAVVAAVPVPVTLKTRTGWDARSRNAVTIARLAEDCGVAALALHGRTRCDFFDGRAEYDTIAAVKQAVRIPVLANGDIDSPEKARLVLDHTGADGLLIGRAALGDPWIFRRVRAFLDGHPVPPPDPNERAALVLEHLAELHAFYGPERGLRVARKHLKWYLHDLDPGFCARLLRVDEAARQYAEVAAFFGKPPHPPEARAA
ncbi:MAG: tRNA-dihydrouridine synthase B [Gammaproteobacteria bacterium]|nr:MAG: tRNA-dihydrouridine synthase B [Gammaproteobacteria bacterium]